MSKQKAIRSCLDSYSLPKGEIPWNIHPRPQLQRDSWLCLNGEWDFSIIKNVNALFTQADYEPCFEGKILVPYPPESKLSGIERASAKDEILVYKRSFTLPAGFNKGIVVLHVDACDQLAEVSLNGKMVGGHTGGYLPLDLDITAFLQDGENNLTIRAWDPQDEDLPYGKQRKKRGGMWYTPISGIWQSVWLESYATAHIDSFSYNPWYDHIDIKLVGDDIEPLTKRLTITTDLGTDIREFTGTEYTYIPAEPHYWTPEDPFLYYYTMELLDKDGTAVDAIHSYFGLRSVTIGTPSDGIARIFINGREYFFHGLLDQGYNPDGIYTYATPEQLAKDIATAKELGFNTLRKHIKIEPMQFYYECDRQGIFVFQDLVNSGHYSFFKDTILPTIGIKRGPTHHASKRRRAYFEIAAAETLKHLQTCCSLILYTIFNEGWGQFNADDMYEQLKELDPTRIFDTASGWFKPKKTDIDSEHVYFRSCAGLKVKDKPVLLTEFGGYACKDETHAFNLDNTYGYTSYPNPAAFSEAFEKLYEEQLMPQVCRGVQGSIYTQLTDVEDETNGLMTYDRSVIKLDKETALRVSNHINAIANLREQDTPSAREAVINGNQPGGILLLGDSITDMYHTERFLKDYRVYNRGFSGNRSDQTRDALLRTLGPLQPDKIFLLIGCNDIGHGFTTEDVMRNDREIAAFIKKHSPNAECYLISVLPTNPDVKTDMPNHEAFCSVRPNSKLGELREAQRALADELGWPFIDVWPAFCGEDGKLREEYTLEGLHLIDAGYEVYTDILTKYF